MCCVYGMGGSMGAVSCIRPIWSGLKDEGGDRACWWFVMSVSWWWMLPGPPHISILKALIHVRRIPLFQNSNCISSSWKIVAIVAVLYWHVLLLLPDGLGKTKWSQQEILTIAFKCELNYKVFACNFENFARDFDWWVYFGIYLPIRRENWIN